VKAKLSAATLKRLEALEQQRGQQRPVAMFPRLVPVDEWEAVAARMQAELKANITKDCPPQYDEGDLSHLVLVASA